MKKFLFSALTCVAFATTGFASNEIVEELKCIENQEFYFKGCTLQVNIVEDGELTDVMYFTGKNGLNRVDCFHWAKHVMDGLAEKGLTIEGYQILRT